MAASFVAAQASESSQKVHLHPLVLLTASDLITRHRLRQLGGPIAGLLLGRQQGTTTTAEYAFAAKIQDGLLDQTNDWTSTRIRQYKEVHQNPALEVVGWFTLCPEDGPLPDHAPIQKQITSLYAENAILLAIHSTKFNAADDREGRLPVSVYESFAEGEPPANDSAMQVDGKEAAGLRFRPVPFAIETDETEMIAINYVAKGAGSAAAVSQTSQSSSKNSEESSSKPQTAGNKEPQIQTGLVLTPEEEDQLAGMTTRLNSVKMLQERLQLMSKSVESIPPSYVSDQTVALTPTAPNPDHLIQLRNIQALISRLALLTPSGQNESKALEQASRAQSNDVAITSILSMLGQDIQGLTELGRKFVSVQQTKSSKDKNKGGFGHDTFGSSNEYNGRTDAGLMMM